MKNRNIININIQSQNQLSHNKVNTIVLFSNSRDDALSFLRIQGPAYAAGLRVIYGAEKGIVHFERIMDGDIVVIQREFFPDFDSYTRIVSIAHSQMKPIVFDLDDLLFELPENHPDRISNYFTESLLPMLLMIMEADLVTVATNALRDYLLVYNKNIKVFPNYLNDNLWTLREPSNNGAHCEKTTIGYMGGHAHKPDLLMVSPVLLRLVEKYSSNIQLKFWGIEPPPELAPFSQVDWCPPKTYDYSEFATYFQSQSAEIMIAPLIDTKFNRCKSSIKYLEYGSLGVPGVFSKITPYESIIENGVDGLLATSPVEWEASLSKLIEDQEFRTRIAVNAQNKIRKLYLLSQNAYKLKQYYEDLAISFHNQEHHVSPFHILVKSLTQQISDNNQRKSQQINESINRINLLQNEITRIDDLNVQLNQQVDQLNSQREDLLNHVNECEEEILSYVLSTSWQITRPLRKISSRLSKGLQ